ncbi:hypothetical protein Tco_0799039 [Tanacetum coccineum]
MNEDYYHEQNPCYDSNSFGFDQFQPPQYTVYHQILNSQNEFFNSQNEQFNSGCEQLNTQITTLHDLIAQAIQKKEEEKRIAEEQAAKERYWKIPICDDDMTNIHCQSHPYINRGARFFILSSPDIKAFSNDHIEETSSGSTTTILHFFFSKYDRSSLIFRSIHIILPLGVIFHEEFLPMNIAQDHISTRISYLLVNPFSLMLYGSFSHFFSFPLFLLIFSPVGMKTPYLIPAFQKYHSSKPDVSHRSGTFMIFNTHRSHLNERSGYQQKDRKPSQNDKTEHGMEKTVQNQGQSPKMPKSESIKRNHAVKTEPEQKNTIRMQSYPSDGPERSPYSINYKTVKTKWALNQLQQPICYAIDQKTCEDFEVPDPSP